MRRDQPAVADRMLRAQAGVSAATIDAWILDGSGILVQAGNADSVRTTVQHLQPREVAGEEVVERAGLGEIRLVFVGKHRPPLIGVVAAIEKVELAELQLLSARHTRLGLTLSAVSKSGGALAQGPRVRAMGIALTALPR